MLWRMPINVENGITKPVLTYMTEYSLIQVKFVKHKEAYNVIDGDWRLEMPFVPNGRSPE